MPITLPKATDYHGANFLDLRPLQSATGPDGACKLSKGKMVMRDPSTVNTLLGHQTAVNFAVAKYQIKEAGGDALLAQFLRARNVHAQVTTFDEGTFACSYPLMAYVYHGNGANAYSIGKEDEGLFNGAPGGKLAEPSDLLIETSRAACTWIVENAAKEGANIIYYEAHRQHAKSRRSDPGWKLWQAVYIDHCEKVLHLKPRPDLTTRDGLKIPKEWDPRQTATY